MAGIIVYKSKYGSTKKYAEWLSEATGFRAVSVKEADISELEKCDTIIVGGGIYASGFAFAPFLKKNIARLKGKKIIAYACGASPYVKEFIDEVIARNMKDDLAGIPVFYCRGTYDLKSMSLADRTLCKMLRKSVAKKDPKDLAVWEAALLEGDENDGRDWTDRSYIEPILAAI